MNNEIRYICFIFCNFLLFGFDLCCFTFKNDSDVANFEYVEYSSNIVKNGKVLIFFS